MKFIKIKEILFIIYCRIKRMLNFGVRFTNKDPEYKNYKIGDYSYGTPRVLYGDNASTLEIGKFCSIAKDVTILLGGNHSTNGATTYPLGEVLDIELSEKTYSNGNVIIGNDVWIGYGATILSGVVIGDGSIVGAGALVSKSVDPYSVIVGNPGKVIKKRFDDKIIKKLLEIKWWDWEIKKIKKNVSLIQGDVNNLIQNEK